LKGDPNPDPAASEVAGCVLVCWRAVRYRYKQGSRFRGGHKCLALAL
jgi:hypothetical protein